jgi:hypothetical protein
MGEGLDGSSRWWRGLAVAAVVFLLLGIGGSISSMMDGDVGIAILRLGFALGWFWIAVAAWRRGRTDQRSVFSQ